MDLREMLDAQTDAGAVAKGALLRCRSRQGRTKRRGGGGFEEDVFYGPGDYVYDRHEAAYALRDSPGCWVLLLPELPPDPEVVDGLIEAERTSKQALAAHIANLREGYRSWAAERERLVASLHSAIGNAARIDRELREAKVAPAVTWPEIPPAFPPVAGFTAPADYPPAERKE